MNTTIGVHVSKYSLEKCFNLFAGYFQYQTKPNLSRHIDRDKNFKCSSTLKISSEPIQRSQLDTRRPSCKYGDILWLLA